MKLDPNRLAGASAVITAGLYIVCAILVRSTPMFYRGVMQSWIHGVDIFRLPGTSLEPLGLIYGLVTMTAVAWGVGYALATVYNALGKK